MNTTTSPTAIDFLQAVFAPGDRVMFRPIEAWTENGKKSRVDYKGVQHVTVNGDAKTLDLAIRYQNTRSEQTKANVFYGVCPRFGGDGHYELAWQIRTVRVLWADVDHCTVDETRERCRAAGLPEPSIIVASGNGAHLYWILAEPYLIDDAGDPPPVVTEFLGKGKKPRKFLKSEGDEKTYIDGKDKRNAPPLSAKAQHVQDILAGIAEKIGGDHTTDLSRLLRVPGTLNRKDQRNGREPVPCTLLTCEPTRRYPISEFAKYAEASPDQAQREALAKVKLPAPRRLTAPKRDRFNELLLICATADVGSRSEADFALCCWAIEHGMPRDTVWSEAQNVGKFSEAGERYFDRTWEKAEIQTRQQTLDKAQAKTQEKADAPQQSGTGRKAIIVGTDESRVIDEAIEALATNENIYQRGGCLVHVVEGAEPLRRIARPKDAPRAVPIRHARLRELLADAAGWFCLNDEQKPERIHPPEWAVKEVDARGQWLGIRRLEGVVESPVLRADGTILQAAGYDESTGIIFRPEGPFPTIPEKPSRADAIRARDSLMEIVEDFPFGNHAHRAAWLASALTPLARYAFHGPSPLYLFDANVRGCGKSLLTDATSIIIAGRPMARMSLPHDDDETRKRITALAIAGEPLILVDNLPAGGFGSPSLDAALTATSWSDRILGQTAMASGIPLYATWYATGNNVILVGDTARRVVHIRLESPEENPEERADFHHPDLRSVDLASNDYVR
jgi:hypothetical protein